MEAPGADKQKLVADEVGVGPRDDASSSRAATSEVEAEPRRNADALATTAADDLATTAADALATTAATEGGDNTSGLSSSAPGTTPSASAAHLARPAEDVKEEHGEGEVADDFLDRSMRQLSAALAPQASSWIPLGADISMPPTRTYGNGDGDTSSSSSAPVPFTTTEVPVYRESGMGVEAFGVRGISKGRRRRSPSRQRHPQIRGASR